VFLWVRSILVAREGRSYQLVLVLLVDRLFLVLPSLLAVQPDPACPQVLVVLGLPGFLLLLRLLGCRWLLSCPVDQSLRGLRPRLSAPVFPEIPGFRVCLVLHAPRWVRVVQQVHPVRSFHGDRLLQRFLGLLAFLGLR